jgi:hypothetical protein
LIVCAVVYVKNENKKNKHKIKDLVVKVNILLPAWRESWKWQRSSSQPGMEAGRRPLGGSGDHPPRKR